MDDELAKIKVPDLSTQDVGTIRQVRLFRPGTLLSDDSEATAPSTSKTDSVEQQPAPSTSRDQPTEDGAVGTPTTESRKPVATANSKPNTIVYNPKQKENPLLKHLRLPHVVDESIEPDYVLTKNCCAFFLSVKYHNLKPTYIYDRYNQLGTMYSLRILLVMVDVSEPRAPLKELTKFAILTNSTLMVCWSFEEAARFLELYKQFEFKSPEILMEKQFTNNKGTEGVYDCVVEALATVKKINKTDAASLLQNFDSLEKMVRATPEKLALCPGLGPLKAEQLHALFRRPFTR